MKLTFTFFALLCCSQSMAQQKFVEVTVSDTVLVKPDLFIYRIMLSPDEEVAEYIPSRKGHRPVEDVFEERQSRERSRLDSLTSALKSSGFVVYPSALGDQVNIIHPGAQYFIARVATHSADSLGILSRRLQGMKGLTGYLEMAIAAQDSSFQAKLFRKILTRARTKAESIAAFSDQHVREVLAVTEDKGEDLAGGWTSYSPLSMLGENVIPGWHTTISGPTRIVAGDLSALGWYPLSGTFTVRFSME